MRAGLDVIVDEPPAVREEPFGLGGVALGAPLQLVSGHGATVAGSHDCAIRTQPQSMMSPQRHAALLKRRACGDERYAEGV